MQAPGVDQRAGLLTIYVGTKRHLFFPNRRRKIDSAGDNGARVDHDFTVGVIGSVVSV